ncbi:hypothetical protein PNOK_0389000 [Pyrrhoderma noxium]|uniref:Uncharacterized protein n=1 Tax=Pyrrhoderma noxium TaxID=2282107 RepID=A0A286UNU6_9AGAM|nr:hypothetical protein PNOK_0389000 [Pyrrhoderma noxium]
MCCWRKVRNVYARCGHSIKLPDEHIDCYSPTCRFSVAHPPTCGPPKCLDSCWQYHQYPQQYAPQIDDWCPDCALKQ